MDDLASAYATPLGACYHADALAVMRRLPDASVSLVLRDGDAMVPEKRTVLRALDDVLVVTPRDVRERTERRLRQVSRHGRRAQWLRETP